MPGQADRDLVERAGRGDNAAVGELFSRYWRAARAAAFGVTGEFASAEDAAAEAFWQALAGMESLRDPDRFGSWLRTITLRKARRALQARPPTVSALPGDLAGGDERPGEALERRELALVVQQAVRELPQALREAVALFYFEGYGSEAAARFLDIPHGTFRRRLHDGRAHLRRAVERALRGSRKMQDKRERQVRRFEAMIANGELYRALRESLALRPPPGELIEPLRRQMTSVSGAAEIARETLQRFAQPSHRASDPKHPAGAIAIAIRKALPEFQNWQPDAGEAAAGFLAAAGEAGDHVPPLLPPGFQDGRPGAFLRATRAILFPDGSERVQGVYELLQRSPDEQNLRAGMKGARLSDTLDLTWMVAGPLELRSVQETLERMAAAVLPGVPVRFSPFDEPRYRSALLLYLGDHSMRAASGGVLAPWRGHPPDAAAAHVRIFLKPWAAAQSGRAVEFDPLPATSRPTR
jgi:RNA polymerase sigma factor (sigma-70 family)